MSPSESDSKLYREKLRERFQAKKQQAKKSRTSLTKHNDELKDLNKMANEIDRENKIINSELNNYTRRTTYLKQAELFNFFSGEKSIAYDSVKDDSEQDNITNKKCTNNLLEDNCLDVIKYSTAENAAFQISLSEKNYFWFPSNSPPLLSSKLNTDEPRYISEEGLFVEKPPNIPNSHLNIFEQRLLGKEDKKWFDCDGNLKISHTPLTHRSLRPSDASGEKLFTKYAQPILNIAELESVEISDDKILEIQIQSLKFQHHPLFSIEHVLQNYLITLYNNYKQQLECKKIERLKKRLDALRNTKMNLEKYLDFAGDESAIERMKKIIEEIRDLREVFFQVNKQHREQTKLILDAWKAIRQIRDKNGYSSTSIKLIIQKEKGSYHHDKRQFEGQIQIICKEVEYELQFRKKYFSNEEKSEDESSQSSNEYDVDSIIDEVVRKFKECFKPPGEPNLHFHLAYDNEITKTIENTKEIQRRNATKATKIYFKLSYGKSEICKSKPITLNDTFSFNINELFSIKIDTAFEHILIEIYEQSGNLLKNKIDAISIKIPNQTQTFHPNKITESFFEKQELVYYKHTGVGSGKDTEYYLQKYNFTLNSIPKVLYTSGVIVYSVGWTVTGVTNFSTLQLSKNLHQPFHTRDIRAHNEEGGKDPQNPRTLKLYERIQNNIDSFCCNYDTKENCFGENADIGDFIFCPQKDMEENIRYKILQLRDKNEPEFCGMIVPNSEREIPRDLLLDYEKRISGENIYKSLQHKEDINSTWAEGKKALRQIYFTIFQKCRNTDTNLLYEDVVNEKTMRQIEYSIRGILVTILNWFRLQPMLTESPLKALRLSNDRSSTIPQNKIPLKIFIHIETVINIPERIKISKFKRSRENNVNVDEESVNLSIEVQYQDKHISTSKANGPNPIWNETLMLEVESLNVDYLNPESLMGSVSLHLYDNLKTDDITHKAEQVWLGSADISVSAIWHSNKIEGLLPVHRPIALFGYENSNENLKNDFSYISLTITSEPKLPKLNPSMEELPTNETLPLKDQILKWNRIYNTNYPDRKFSALAIDIYGKTSCLTRFIKALELPQLNFEHLEITPDQYAKYISLFPFTNYNKFYQNIWLTSEQFLKMTIGSIIDHAAILTCCLLSLGLEAWLLLGFGIPHGSCAYVLVKEYSEHPEFSKYFIYDVVTASKYYTTETLCPLQNVYCLVNDQNIWANIQKTDDIPNTRFDVLQKCDWLPLFTNDVAEPICIMQQKAKYSYTPETHDLEYSLEKKVRRKISKYRKHDRTKWNVTLSKTLKSLITKFDNTSNENQVVLEIMEELMKLQLSHNVRGFIVNKPYINSKTLFEFIENTKILLHGGINTEYVLITHLVPYPNQVINMWLLIALIF